MITTATPTPEQWDAASRVVRGVQPKHTFLDDYPKQQDSGSNGNYYKAQALVTYADNVVEATVECNDIIEALHMNFAEGNAQKALWRKANARLGNAKEGHSPLYDAQKVKWSGNRLIEQANRDALTSTTRTKHNKENS